MTSSATTTARGKSGATATICRSRKKNSREEREPVPLRSLGIRRASGTRRSARGGRRAAAARLKASPSFDQTGARAFQASETFDHTVEREPSGEGDVRIRQWSASLSGERDVRSDSGARAFEASETFDQTVEREPLRRARRSIRQWSASLSGE